MEEQAAKECSSCGEEKFLDEFGFDNRAKDGYRGVCKTCYNQRRCIKKPNKIQEKTTKIPSKPMRSASLKPIYSEIRAILEKYSYIIDALDNPVFTDMDMTIHMQAIKIEYLSKVSELEKEYQNVLHPPKDKFNIDSADLLPSVSIIDSDNLIPIMQSKLQFFIMTTKGIHSDISIIYNLGTYEFHTESVKLKNEEITNFFVSSNLVLSTYTSN